MQFRFIFPQDIELDLLHTLFDDNTSYFFLIFSLSEVKNKLTLTDMLHLLSLR